MPSQNRFDLSKPLSFHDQRDASTLVAEQISDVLTTAQVMPDNKDTARINAAGGAVNVTVPLGTDDNIGIVYKAIKTDSSGNAAGLACPSGQTMPNAATSLTTTTQDAEVALKWDGTYWRNANPGSGSAGGALAIGSSLTVGDGTGSTTIIRNKSNAGTAVDSFRVGATERGRLSLDASESMFLAQYDASGVECGKLSFHPTNGAATLSKALTISTGGLTISAGGANITGGLTVVDVGLTVTAGGATISAGGLTVAAGNINLPLASIPDYADDAAAAVGGVAVGRQYRTGSILKIRVA